MKKLIKKNFKRLGSIGLAAMLAFSCLALTGLNVSSKTDTKAIGGALSQYGTFYPEHTVSWANGAAGFGTSVETYDEGGTTYYQDGSIVCLTIKLPVNNKCVALADDIVYNPSQLELLSSYAQIGSTQDSYYNTEGWSAYVAGETTSSTEAVIHYINDVVYNTPDTHTDASQAIARIYFKVKSGVSTEAGTAIKFSFPSWQVADAEFNFMTPNYDASDSGGTYKTTCPDVTFVAKKVAKAETFPTITLTTDNQTIYEGDVFNPQDVIKSVVDSEGGKVDASDVTITGGDNVFTKHVPKAGTYTYTYSVTDNYGQTSTKEFTLTVTKRTYTIDSVSVDGKDIKLPNGSTEDDLKEALKDSDGEFDVVLSCNDGTKVNTKYVSTGGTASGYAVNSDGTLKDDQEFDVTWDLVAPIISYDSDGNRSITPYNGSDKEAWEELAATPSTTATTKVIVGNPNGSTGGNTNNGSNGGANTNSGSTTNESGTSSSNTGNVKTGDYSPETFVFMMLMLISTAYIGIRSYRFLNKE
ncbi:MAG: hypothetical protein PHH04_07020 [Thomasclavelia sp.]|jgi:hypothetical protein|nr:hypothetical protein [Thomasclavelia sp.]